MKVTESLLDLRGIPPADGGPEACRGTLELDDGDVRRDWRLDGGASVFPSPFSSTPNSFVDGSPGMGEGSADGAVTLRLTRLLTKVFCPEPSAGEPAADVRLDMRGILVGVSLERPPMELRREEGGWSLDSLEAL